MFSGVNLDSKYRSNLEFQAKYLEVKPTWQDNL